MAEVPTIRLTEQQRRFVTEFIVDLNATAAAKRANYSEKTAGQIGHNLLKKVEIQAAIAIAQAERAERTQVTADMVVRELALLGFSNMQDYMRVGPDGDPWLDFSELTRDQAAALQEVTVEDFKDGRGDDARDVRRVKFKLADKKSALEQLGKHLGMFSNRVEITGRDGGPVEITPVPMDADRLREVARTLAEVLPEPHDEGSGDDDADS